MSMVWLLRGAGRACWRRARAWQVEENQGQGPARHWLDLEGTPRHPRTLGRFDGLGAWAASAAARDARQGALPDLLWGLLFPGGAPRNVAGLRCGGAARVPSSPVPSCPIRSGRPLQPSCLGTPGQEDTRSWCCRNRRFRPHPGPGATPRPMPGALRWARALAARAQTQGSRVSGSGTRRGPEQCQS